MILPFKKKKLYGVWLSSHDGREKFLLAFYNVTFAHDHTDLVYQIPREQNLLQPEDIQDGDDDHLLLCDLKDGNHIRMSGDA